VGMLVVRYPQIPENPSVANNRMQFERSEQDLIVEGAVSLPLRVVDGRHQSVAGPRDSRAPGPDPEAGTVSML
jgi:hypothetical protein